MADFETQALAPLRVVVLYGGTSAEREISLQSGRAVAQALASRGHTVTQLDPAETDIATFAWNQQDAAFVALHGTFGEDGQVQEILEQLGIPFTGSDSVSSRLAFSKSATKERFLQHAVPTPSYVLVHKSDTNEKIRQHADAIGYPLVVKPDAQGSSLGVSLVRSANELDAALTRCFDLDAFCLLEVAVPGTEWTLGMLDDNALPLIQIETNHEFFDFDAKYQDHETRYCFEFELTGNVIQLLETVGRQACQVLGTRGLARVDIRLDRCNQPWVLEVNTIPGLTDHSLVPKAASRLGIDFPTLCESALRSCLRLESTGPRSR